MADNTVLNAGAGGDTIASDDIGGIKYPIGKLAIGALDAQTLATGGSGTVDAGTQRVVLATDVALPAGANAIGKLAANSGVTIGAIEIAAAQTLSTVTTVSTVSAVTAVGTITPGFAATSLGKRQDDAVGATDVGVAMMAKQLATPANVAGTDGDYEVVQMSAGRLWVDASGKTLTVGSHAVTNAGTFAVQIDSGAVTSLALIDDPVIQDDNAFTPATTKVMMAGFQADETGTDSVDEGDGGAARMTLDRKQIVTVEPHTAGGLSVANMTSGDGSTALTNSAQAIKASAGQLYGWYIYNPNATAAYVPIYNTASGSVTVGTTNPLFVITIPATSAANIIGANGIAFSNAGFSAAAATTAGGNTALGTALEANFFYY